MICPVGGAAFASAAIRASSRSHAARATANSRSRRSWRCGSSSAMATRIGIADARTTVMRNPHLVTRAATTRSARKSALDLLNRDFLTVHAINPGEHILLVSETHVQGAVEIERHVHGRD